MRHVPAALQAHLDAGVTTTCRLLRIDLPDGTSTGLTTHDQPLEYQGVVYSAARGFNPTAIATDSSYSVDNSEGYALLSGTLEGITEDAVLRGDLEGATWELMLVNWRDLDAGHLTLDAGDVGEVRLEHGVVWIPELVSYMMRLRQTIGHVDSVSCRAIFGNQQQGQLYCGYDAEALWQEGAVVTVAEEAPHHVFNGDGANVFRPPGRLQWLTGPNASSKLYQLEVVEEDRIVLFEPLPFAISPGDTYRVRPDCDKTFTTCRDRWSNHLEFRGEPLIPLGEASTTPGGES